MSIARNYRLFTTVSADKRTVEDIYTSTGAETLYSNPVRTNARDSFSLHMFWTGTTTVGTAAGLTLWVSNVPSPILTDDTEWSQVTWTPATFPNGSAGKLFDTVGNIPAVHWRLKLVITGGAGTLRGYSPVT